MKVITFILAVCVASWAQDISSSPPPMWQSNAGHPVAVPPEKRGTKSKTKPSPPLPQEESLFIWSVDGKAPKGVRFNRCAGGNVMDHVEELSKGLAAHDAGELAKWCLDGHPLAFAPDPKTKYHFTTTPVLDQ